MDANLAKPIQRTTLEDACCKIKAAEPAGGRARGVVEVLEPDPL